MIQRDWGHFTTEEPSVEVLETVRLPRRAPSATGTASSAWFVVAAATTVPFYMAKHVQRQIRQVLQPALISMVVRQLRWIRLVQSFAHPVVDLLVQLNALTVTTEFFVLILPVVFWSGHQMLSMSMIACLAFCSYFTFTVKDLLCSPRPADAGTAKDALLPNKDPTAEAEYGAPSGHVSLSICWMFLLIHGLQAEGFITGALAGHLSIAAAGWVAWTAFCRLYLGVHSPIDLFLGGVIGIAALCSWELSVQHLWLRLVSTTNVAFVQLFSSGLLIMLHPKPETFTVSLQHVTTFLGAWYGASLQVSRFDSWPAGPYYVSPPALAARTVIGSAVMLIAKSLTKRLLMSVLPVLLDLVPPSIRQNWQPPVAHDGPQGKPGETSFNQVLCSPKGTPWDAEIAARFASYAATVLAMAEVPALFDSLGI